jgi:TonB family protein
VLAHGELVSPRWLRRIEDSRGRSLELLPPVAPRRVWPAEVAEELRELLVGVTTRGTARRAFIGPDGLPLLGAVRVSGKTGTLSGTDPAGVYQWFIGVAPAEEPRIAIASVVVNGSAGHGAPRIAAEILQRIVCDRGRCAPDVLEAHLAPSVHRRTELAEIASQPPALPVAEELPPLDSIPRPIDAPTLDFPRRLREKPASGRIVLLLELGADGGVRDVAVEGSDLPEFDEFVASAVRRWRFTPPTRGGVPVEARARLPIPIRVK